MRKNFVMLMIPLITFNFNIQQSLLELPATSEEGECKYKPVSPL